MSTKNETEIDQRLATMPCSELLAVMKRHCFQITKGGYRWRDWWEVRVPAPGGHYQEEAERVVGSAPELHQAITKALISVGHLPNAESTEPLAPKK